MSGGEFTKGPWAVRATDTVFHVENADGIQVVKTSWHGHIFTVYPSKSDAFANATLCAAAPDLAAAAKGILASRSSTYKARNGRVVGIEDDSGEMMWIVPFDEMAALEAALLRASGKEA